MRRLAILSAFLALGACSATPQPEPRFLTPEADNQIKQLCYPDGCKITPSKTWNAYIAPFIPKDSPAFGTTANAAPPPPVKAPAPTH